MVGVSDGLLVFMLKALRPTKYRDPLKVDMGVSDREGEGCANGRHHPLSNSHNHSEPFGVQPFESKTSIEWDELFFFCVQSDEGAPNAQPLGFNVVNGGGDKGRSNVLSLEFLLNTEPSEQKPS